MANFAYVEDSIVVGVYDQLPTNWKNISNFNTLSNETDYLISLGWLPIVRQDPIYDFNIYTIGLPTYTIDGNTVIESNTVIAKPSGPTAEEIAAAVAVKWADIRIKRDLLMSQTDWRYLRYERQVRLGMTPVDTIEALDTYMNALAIITEQLDPDNIIWPSL